VLGVELITTGIKRKLESAAKMLAASKAAAFVAGAGTISTAVSGYQAVECTWKCVKR
jgi:hypothetical protein